MSAIRRRKLLFLTACSSVEPAPQRTESDMSSDHSNDHGHGKSARCRDIYLKIEKLPAYSPVAPENGEHDRYGRPTAGSWSALGQQEFDDRQEGMAVITVDT